MLFFLMILCIEIALKTSIYAKKKFNKEYLSKENTQGIKGLFVILILFSHFTQYVSLDSIWDKPYLALRGHLDQMVVAPFLFYSGVGIMKSIQIKGDSYVKEILVKRFPKVWIDFIVAVCWFLVLNVILGITYPIKQILLSFVGWTSIGNSNWYILGILILYILSFIAFSVTCKISNKIKREVIGNIILTILIIGIVCVFRFAGRPSYYYNTLIIYSLGCWYAVFQKKIDDILMKNNFMYTIGFAAVICVYCLAYSLRWQMGIISYTAWAVLFTIMLVMTTMKFSVKSNVLNWFGKHVFSVYILQRIPMIVLQYLGVLEKHNGLFLIVSLACTVIMVVVFENHISKIENFLMMHFHKKMDIRGENIGC